MLSLSPRLAQVYSYCLPDIPLWDLCCDHGYLGFWALQTESHPEVIFNDVLAHLLAPLPAKFLQHSSRARIVGGAAEDIAEPLTGNIVIAGVGAERILKILGAHHERGTLLAQRIIVCPEKDADWMMAQGLNGHVEIARKQIPHTYGHRWIVAYEPTASQTHSSTPPS